MATERDCVIAADIGGSHISCCAVDLADGQIADGSIVDAPVDGKAGKGDILEAWANAIRTVAERQSSRAPAGVGFAMPGAFDYQTGVAGFRGNDKFESLFGVNVAEALADSLGRPMPMRFINDATAFAVGTAWRGAGRGYERSIAVTLGTGFGSGFVDAGLPVVTGDRVPEHGSLWHLPYRDGIADDYVSTRWFEKQYLALTGYPVNGVKTIAEHAGRDPDVAALFRRFGGNLGELVAPWVRRFGAEALILGGNVAGALDLFAPTLNDVLNAEGADVAVVVCPLRESAALLGAARLFDGDFWNRVRHDLPRA